jgi:hypothetical protein
MADLTLSQLDAQLPADAMVAAGGDVMISLKALMGEDAVALNDAKVSEFVSKLLDACSKAQALYNSANANGDADLNSFPSPIAGIPVQDAVSGFWYSSFTHTVSVNVPLSRNETTGVTL